MKIWHQYPFIRLVISLLAGIMAAMYLDRPIHNNTFVILFLLSLFGLIVIAAWMKIKYSYKWVPGVLIGLFLFAAGFFNANLNTPKFNDNNIIHFSDGQSQLLVQVTEPVAEKPNSYKILARSIGFQDSLDWQKTTGQIVLYFEKDSTVLELEYGDWLIIQTSLNLVNAPQNPNEFNYKKYLSNKGIYSQGYVRSGSWRILKRNTGYPIYRLGYNLRRKFANILETNGINGKEFAVASAILLGYDEYLDSEQVKEFAGAGAMHILCVSGLHVGIIYVILNNLLMFLNRKRILRIIKVILLLLLIWTYALITGLSPSVLRASTMFTFIILGSSMRRKANIYNSIAASAFALMIINPFIITQVGFQLSYLAVLGIVLLYKPIVNIFVPRNLMLRWIWQMSVVSIAATLATFPLSLFYFHQFPNLFLITNLVAIPASMLIIYTGILVLIFSPLTFLSGLIAKVLAGIIWVLNFSVSWIEGLSFSVSENVYINGIEMILLFGISISLTIFFLQSKNKYVFYILVFAVFLIASFTYRNYTSLIQKNIMVYNISKSSAIDFISQKSDLLLADSILTPNKTEYHINNYWVASSIKHHTRFDLDENHISHPYILKMGNFIQFYSRKMILVDPEFIFYEYPQKVNVDFIIISQNPYIQMGDLKASFNFDRVIFDASNSYWNTKRWKEQCNKLEIEFCDVKTNGAWIVSI